MDQGNISILAKFPEYGFKSTTIYNKKPPRQVRGLILSIIIGLLVGIYGVAGATAGMYELLEGKINYNTIDVVLTIFAIALASIYLYVYIKYVIVLRYKRWNGIRTISFADYIQSKGRMRFFVKNGKFGLVKWKNFNIQVPAMYDKLMWVQENEVMKANLNGEEFLIDIHNNKLR